MHASVCALFPFRPTFVNVLAVVSVPLGSGPPREKCHGLWTWTFGQSIGRLNTLALANPSPRPDGETLNDDPRYKHLAGEQAAIIVIENEFLLVNRVQKRKGRCCQSRFLGGQC